ncbi:hypothetical protein SFRURICE_008539, partial [Spodoptera frugiperda]
FCTWDYITLAFNPRRDRQKEHDLHDEALHKRCFAIGYGCKRANGTFGALSAGFLKSSNWEIWGSKVRRKLLKLRVETLFNLYSSALLDSWDVGAADYLAGIPGLRLEKQDNRNESAFGTLIGWFIRSGQSERRTCSHFDLVKPLQQNPGFVCSMTHRLQYFFTALYPRNVTGFLLTCVHLATERYRSAGPSFASSYSPKSVTPVQSDTLSSFNAQYDGIHRTPASGNKRRK